MHLIYFIYSCVSLFIRKKKNFVTCSYLKLVKVKPFNHSNDLEFLIMSKS